MRPKCSDPSCTARAVAKGFCQRCYKRTAWRRKKVAQATAIDSPEWRDVPGYEGIFQAHADGRIRSRRVCTGRPVGHVFATKKGATGYLQVNPRINGRRLYLYQHRLVAFAFHGLPPTSEHEVNHKNGVRADNRAENLEWVTPMENVQDAIARGSPVGRRRKH